MAHALRRGPEGPMAGAEFRAFQDGRPDRERWELVAGTPVMMSPPTLAHQRIASRLERLLNDALEDHDPTMAAFQACGVELGAPDGYKPEPDVAVLDREIAPGQRIATRAYLLAEVLSSTDDEPAAAGGPGWIGTKRAIYRSHGPARVVLSIRQDRCEVTIETRREGGWDTLVLEEPDDWLDLPAFGLRCQLRDLYAGVPLLPRPPAET